MGMKVIWSKDSWGDFEYWLDHDQKIAKRIRKLIKNIIRTPFKGIGKPEPLKGDMSGLWSRKIDDKHRLVYYVEKNSLYIVAARFHYHK